jgi:hypothetical protein
MIHCVFVSSYDVLREETQRLETLYQRKYQRKLTALNE